MLCPNLWEEVTPFLPISTVRGLHALQPRNEELRKRLKSVFFQLSEDDATAALSLHNEDLFITYLKCHAHALMFVKAMNRALQLGAMQVFGWLWAQKQVELSNMDKFLCLCRQGDAERVRAAFALKMVVPQRYYWNHRESEDANILEAICSSGNTSLVQWYREHYWDNFWTERVLFQNKYRMLCAACKSGSVGMITLVAKEINLDSWQEEKLPPAPKGNHVKTPTGPTLLANVCLSGNEDAIAWVQDLVGAFTATPWQLVQDLFQGASDQALQRLLSTVKDYKTLAVVMQAALAAKRMTMATWLLQRFEAKYKTMYTQPSQKQKFRRYHVLESAAESNSPAVVQWVLDNLVLTVDDKELKATMVHALCNNCLSVAQWLIGHAQIGHRITAELLGLHDDRDKNVLYTIACRSGWVPIAWLLHQFDIPAAALRGTPTVAKMSHDTKKQLARHYNMSVEAFQVK